MTLTIAARLRPFSHQPGIAMPLPGTSLAVTLYPARVAFFDLSKNTAVGFIDWQISGPVLDWTAILDLEKERITVFGENKQGYFRYHLQSQAGVPAILLEKGDSLAWSCGNSTGVLLPKEIALFPTLQALLSASPVPAEYLSLGSHKKLLWEHVQERLDLRDILPVWLKLAQQLPSSNLKATGGTFALLALLEQSIQAGDRLAIEPHFQTLLRAAFNGILVPATEDRHHLGLNLIPSVSPPYTLLLEGAKMIRALFIQERNEGIALLPALPPRFDCGRFLEVKLNSLTLSFEWSKGLLRRVKLTPHSSIERLFLFQKELQTMRIRRSLQDKGSVLSCGTALKLEAGQVYLLDRFTR